MTADQEKIVADHAAEVERLKGLLREYRDLHFNRSPHACATYSRGGEWALDERCELCQRTDQLLENMGTER